MEKLSFSGRMTYFVIRYILIGLGIYIGNVLISFMIPVLSIHLPSNPIDLLGLILIPLSVLTTTLVILFRFSREHEHQSELADGRILGRAGIKFVVASLLVGVLLMLASRSFVIALSWLLLVFRIS
jgi:membrane protein implicated in regulation of membrane protease activity